MRVPQLQKAFRDIVTNNAPSNFQWEIKLTFPLQAMIMIGRM